MTQTLSRYREILTRCLGSRISAELRAEIIAALARKRGRVATIDRDEVARLNALGMASRDIAEQLGCSYSAVVKLLSKIKST